MSDSISGGVAGGGTQTGSAHGSIVIDTASLRQMADMARQFSRQAEQALQGVDRATERTEGRFQRLNRGIASVRGELAGLAAGAGLLTALGLRAASQFENLRIQVVGMMGGIEAGNEAMERLRTLATELRVPLNATVQAFASLGPLIDNDIDRFRTLLDLARRLAVRNPREGISGAAFSIGEALSSGGTDLVSLVERFNIPRGQIREAVEATGDFAAALDMVLTRMGLTSDVADEMGDSFSTSLARARDAASQLLAVGFQPLLDALTPLIQGAANFANRIRESNPEIATFGAGLAAIATLAAPSLLILNQMVEAAIKLRNLGILAAAGRAGAVGIGAGIGAAVGIGAVNAAGRASGDSTLRDFSLQQAATELANMLRQWRSEWAMLILDATQFTANAFYNAIDAIGQFVAFIGRITFQTRLQEAGAGAQGLAERGRAASDALASNMRAQLLQGGVALSQATAADQAAAGGAGGDLDNTRAVRIQFAQDMARIEREAGEQRVRITEQYARQRAETIRNFEQTIAREAADFARQRARAIADHEAQIARIRQDAAERDTRWAEELNERIADIREQAAQRSADATADHERRIAELRESGNERIAELEAAGQRDRERALRRHRDTLLNAASRLDARAVAQEMRRFSTAQAEQEQALAERLTKEQESLEERIQAEQEQFDRRRQREQRDLAQRIAQEQEAHAKRLEDARAADAQRIEDMQAAFAQQIAREDEDRAIRLGRMAKDHNDQLAEMARAHGDQLREIEDAKDDQLEALEDAHTAELEELGRFNQAWQKLQDAREADALRSWDAWWASFNRRFPAPMQGPQPQLPDFHDPDTNVFNTTPTPTTNTNRTNNVTVSSTVYAAPGQSPEDIADAVDRQIVRRLTEIGEN